MRPRRSSQLSYTPVGTGERSGAPAMTETGVRTAVDGGVAVGNGD
jgi:hypothetical protein